MRSQHEKFGNSTVLIAVVRKLDGHRDLERRRGISTSLRASLYRQDRQPREEGEREERKPSLKERSEEMLNNRGRIGGWSPALSVAQKDEVRCMRDKEQRAALEIVRLFKVSERTPRRA